MPSNWTSACKFFLICVDRLPQCCASLEYSSPAVSYSVTKPHHWNNNVDVFTDSEVKSKRALPATLIRKWLWELLKNKNFGNGKTLKDQLYCSSWRFLVFEILRLPRTCNNTYKNVSTFPVLPRGQKKLLCSCLACG